MATTKHYSVNIQLVINPEDYSNGTVTSTQKARKLVKAMLKGEADWPKVTIASVKPWPRKPEFGDLVRHMGRTCVVSSVNCKGLAILTDRSGNEALTGVDDKKSWEFVMK